MLKVVITRVDGLIVGVVAGETFDGDAEHARHEQPVTLRECGQIRGLDLYFNCGRIFCRHRQGHLPVISSYTVFDALGSCTNIWRVRPRRIAKSFRDTSVGYRRQHAWPWECRC